MTRRRIVMVQPPPELEEVVYDKNDTSSSSSSSSSMPATVEEEEVVELEEEDFTAETASRYGIPSWTAYRNFWATHYPNLKVSRPAEDICSYCYKFHNRFRYKQRANFQQPSANDDHSAFVCPPIVTSPPGAAGLVVLHRKTLSTKNIRKFALVWVFLFW
jgi:hypothetical protein